jgi:uncharacterized protein YkwD
MKKCKSISLVLSAMCALMVTGCGGGSGSGSTETTAGDAASQAASKLDHTCQLPNFNEEFIARINTFRASGAVCGGEVMPKVGSLVWNQKLQNAATVHARNEANLNFYAHVGLDGSTPKSRATAAGYDGGVGENIHVQVQTIEQVFAGWVNSPPHCKNMMLNDYREFAVSCADNATSTYGRYWVMALGIPSASY